MAKQNKDNNNTILNGKTDVNVFAGMHQLQKGGFGHKKLLLLWFLVLVMGAGGCRKNLHEAVSSNDLRRVIQLIGEGANVNEKNRDGETPLQLAAMSNCVDIAGVLIQSGADLKARDRKGWTALHMATASSQYTAPVAELLIMKGANVNTQSSDNSTPLHTAIMGGDPYKIKLLLQKGVNVNAQ